MDAEVRGTVEMRGECLVLVQEDAPGAPAYPDIWPAGTTWQEDLPAVVLEGGQVVELGTAVFGGGGCLQAGHIEDSAGSAVADAADRCTGDTGEIALFNTGSDVQVM